MMENIELGAYLRHNKVDPLLTALIESVAGSAVAIADHLKNSGSTNQIDSADILKGQRDLQLLADRVFRDECADAQSLAGLVSREATDVVWLKAPSAGDLVLYLYPLDGSPYAGGDLTVGSIFAVSQIMTDGNRDVLRRGREYLCAGYVIYGPSTMLMLTFGVGVIGFTLDHDDARFKFTHGRMRIPAETNDIAVDASHQNKWDEAFRRYVDECVKGKEGPRGRGFNVRGTTSMVADLHRILIHGGVLLSPAHDASDHPAGQLGMMYETNPLAYLVEAAGGRASTGYEGILGIQPQFFDQPASVLLGSSDEIDRLVHLHKIHQVSEEIAS